MVWLKLTLLLALVGCADVGPPKVEGDMRLGGQVVEGALLKRGRASYIRYCQSCHGPQGDGQGPLGLHQQPPARDLRLGIIKYASVPAGGLPTDADLRRIIRQGLVGTAMLPWRVEDAELGAVVQYIKVFSPRWRDERAGEPITVSPDPWSDLRAGIARGERVYHKLGCARCHPAMLPAAQLEKIAVEDGVEPSALLRSNPHVAAVTESIYGPLKATDFRLDPLRNGDAPADIYRVIAAGVGGTAMPTWKGAASEEDLWALVHYVRSLR